jgi:hypothetical protein
MVLRENTKDTVVDGDAIFETLTVETATGVHSGLIVKCDSSDTAVELADANDLAVGVCGYLNSPADSQPTDVDTAYATDADAAVIYGGDCVLMMELALGFSVAKGDTLIAWTDGQVAGPWNGSLGLGIGFTSTAGTAVDTGVNIEDETLILDAAVEITTLDAGQVVDVGFINAVEGGDEDGLIDGLSTATAGITVPAATVTTGSTETFYASTTYGAYLTDFHAGVDDGNCNQGVHYRKPYETDGTITSVSYTGDAVGAVGVIWLKLSHKNLQIAGVAMDTINATSAADRVMTHFTGLRGV